MGTRYGVTKALPWAVVALAASCNTIADEWSAYGRDPGGTRYSPLVQITPDNVGKLQVAWTFHTGDVSDGSNGVRRSGFETTPLVMEGRLYLTTPFNRVIALDPVTGRQLWAHDPKVDKALPYGDGLVNRGLASWRDPQAVGRPCALRLFEATLDARLIALDASNGEPCQDFGAHGAVDLRDVARYVPGWYHMTSPPVVLDGVVVVGSSMDDNARVDMPDGVVRGYDARTGKLLWKWEPLERPAGVAESAWRTGAGGLIFIGGTMDRRFRALAADTGKELWSAALPASAHALPITYAAGGRQFVVIAAGANAHIDEERRGDTLVAFALPP